VGAVMIVRKNDYDGFKCFDFFNDAEDTERWLRRVGRNDEDNELNIKTLEWFESKSKPERDEIRRTI
jgi:hypothetical protein